VRDRDRDRVRVRVRVRVRDRFMKMACGIALVSFRGCNRACGGCNRTCWRLQPYVLEAATVRAGGCNRTWWGLVCTLVAGFFCAPLASGGGATSATGMARSNPSCDRVRVGVRVRAKLG
jgi:hypothetical protein